MEQQHKQHHKQKQWLPLTALVAASAIAGGGIAYLVMPKQHVAPAVSASPADESPKANQAKPAEVKIPAAYLATANISVEAVQRGSANAELLASGTVVAHPGDEAQVVAHASGIISKVNFHIGDPVRAGEVLALVESTDAANLSAEHEIAVAKLELAKKRAAREAELFKQGITPRQDMESEQSALQVAEAEVQRTASVAKTYHMTADGRSVAVISPITGKISASSITLGAFVQPQTDLFHVSAAQADAEIEASVPSTEVQRIAVGDHATIKTSSGSSVEAYVHSFTAVANENTQTATVILHPVAANPALIIGSGVQARIHIKTGNEQLIVSGDAVQNVDGHDVVFVKSAKGFTVRPVLVGQRNNDMAEILSGVQQGEQIATHNAFLIKAEMQKSTEDDE